MVAKQHQSIWRRVLLTVVLGVLILLVVPLIIPVPESDGIDPAVLAADDATFIRIGAYTVHYAQQGTGEDIVLIHGDGAGVFSWGPVFDDLAAIGRVTAYDRTGWGYSERPVVDSGASDNPYDSAAHFRQFTALVNEFELEQFTIIAHGEGANLAVRLARALPENVTALVLEAPIIESTDTSVLATFEPILRTPQIRHLAPFYVRWRTETLTYDVEADYFDPANLTPELRAAYTVQTEAANWEGAMWENSFAPQLPDVTGELSLLQQPTLLITGVADLRVTPSRSEAIAEAIGAGLDEPGGAELVTIGACGHIPHEECPDEFLAAVLDFLGR